MPENSYLSQYVAGLPSKISLIYKKRETHDQPDRDPPQSGSTILTFE